MRFLLLVFVTFLSIPVLHSQVQQNGAEASLLIEDRTLDGFGGLPTFEWIPGTPLSIEITGGALEPVALLIGESLEPGLRVGPPGFLNLTQPAALLDGFAPGGFLFRTGPLGAFRLNLTSSLPIGSELALQAVVGRQGELRLSGPLKLRAGPARLAYATKSGLRGSNRFGTSDTALSPPIRGSARVREYSFSPNGQQVALVSGSGQVANPQVLVAPVTGSALGAVTTLFATSNFSDTVTSLRWSPDGTSIAFLHQTGSSRKLHMALADGSSSIALPEAVLDFAWNHDGSKLAFREATVGELYVVDADGSNSTLVAPPPSRPFFVGPKWAWSPDSRYIAYREDEFQNARLYIVQPDGTSPLELSDEASDFAWSPDAKNIAWINDKTTFPFSEDLFVNEIGVPGARKVNGTQFTFSVEVTSFSWSPDSRFLAYLSNEDGRRDELFAVRKDGDQSTRRNLSFLLSGGDEIEEYSWSPCSEWLAFRNRLLSDSIYTSSLSGEAHVITDQTSATFSAQPYFRWSPDSRSPLLAYFSEEDAAIQGLELYASEPDGSQKRRMSGFERISLDDNFQWDPSGRWIAFYNAQMFVNAKDGNELTTVSSQANLSAGDVPLSFLWSPSTPPKGPNELPATFASAGSPVRRP